MKKKLAGLALTLGALALSAACATSGASGTKTAQPPQFDPGENWAKAASSVAGQPAKPAAVPKTRFASR